MNGHKTPLGTPRLHEFALNLNRIFLFVHTYILLIKLLHTNSFAEFYSAKLGTNGEKGLANSQNRLAIVILQVECVVFRLSAEINQLAIQSFGVVPVTALKARKNDDSEENPEQTQTSESLMPALLRNNCLAYSTR